MKTDSKFKRYRRKFEFEICRETITHKIKCTVNMEAKENITRLRKG